MALAAVFLLAAALYIWRTAQALPLTLHGWSSTPYNQLADAFLHFRYWIVHIPASELGPEPYNPAVRPAFLSTYFPDYALYNGYIYLIWGPVPVLVLLIPLHLLGYEPSGSVIIAPFAVAGLGFALAALRVILRQIGDVSLWICMLAALVLASASAVPYIMQLPIVYHEAIAAGYCFAMAGIWLALSAIIDRRTSRTRLGLASLCFGLAVGSRPTLVVAALVLVPVYLSLRAARRDRGQLVDRGQFVALTLPLATCLILLAAYNEARYGNPLEIGGMYQINGGNYHAHWGELSYVAPGVWSYLLTPPRLNVIFPFFSIIRPQAGYPTSYPAHYAFSEQTGGLLVMAPIMLFLGALPWMWRRRPALLGPLGLPLLLMASASTAIMLFLAFYIFGTTERYEVDFATLLLFGALAVWLALSAKARGPRRRLAQVGGGLLAVWSCVTGLAIGYQDMWEPSGTQRDLVNLGSPLSTAIAAIAGHAVLAEVYTPNIISASPEDYSGIGTRFTGFWLGIGDQVELTIVSPDRRKAALAGNLYAGAALRRGAALAVHISGPDSSSHNYRVSTSGKEVLIPVGLIQGVNRLVLSAVPTATNVSNSSSPESRAVMIFSSLHLAGG